MQTKALLTNNIVNRHDSCPSSSSLCNQGTLPELVCLFICSLAQHGDAGMLLTLAGMDYTPFCLTVKLIEGILLPPWTRTVSELRVH